jgi:hypothetical protein
MDGDLVIGLLKRPPAMLFDHVINRHHLEKDQPG